MRTKGSMMPNPGRRAAAERPGDAGDEVVFVWYTVVDDHPGRRSGVAGGGSDGGSGGTSHVRHGLVLRVDGDEAAVAERAVRRRRGLLAMRGWRLSEVHLVNGEVELLTTLARVVRDVDADILLAWDVRASWQYLVERANTLGIEPPLVRQLGRTPLQQGANEDREDEWGEVTNSGLKIVGRLLVNEWRSARSELAITSFTIESVAAKVLQERVPVHTRQLLNRWWDLPMGGGTTADGGTAAAVPAAGTTAGGGPAVQMRRDEGRVRVLAYYARRVSLALRIAEAMEIVPRTSELARVFGIDFTSVLTRGSQYRVESMLLRLCRTQGYAVASPDQAQVKTQAAPHALALIMEPEGKFYNSPVIVLDFRSLYPSVIIAYNYCYSTCLGPLHSLHGMLEGGTQPHRFGCLDLSARGFCTTEEAERAGRNPAAQLHTALNRLNSGRPLCASDPPPAPRRQTAAGDGGGGSGAVASGVWAVAAA